MMLAEPNVQNLPYLLAQVQTRVSEASRLVQRPVADVHLLAVSKMQSAQSVRQLYQCGQRNFGENYLQEALEKQAILADLVDLNWHFIGSIQRNKTRDVAHHFSWVHTVDRWLIAQRLSEQRPQGLPRLNLCIQVNLDGEASKSGCSVEALPDLALAVAQLPNVCLRGLMAIPAPGNTGAFSALSDWLHRLQSDIPAMDTLSMGMSADLESAIAAGATWVRVGTALFGSRLRGKSP